MSFKRDGDDSAWLLNLQKRRVSELLVSDIPSDEALLTKNGRLACLVCSHRPVLDTVGALTVHRSGKKHATNVEYFYAKKRELEELKEKRLHSNTSDFSRSSKHTPDPPSVDHAHPLLVSAPYSSKIRRLKPYERRKVLQVTPTVESSTNQNLSQSDPTPTIHQSAYQRDIKTKDNAPRIKSIQKSNYLNNVKPIHNVNGQQSNGCYVESYTDVQHVLRPDKLTNSLHYRKRITETKEFRQSSSSVLHSFRKPTIAKNTEGKERNSTLNIDKFILDDVELWTDVIADPACLDEKMDQVKSKQDATMLPIGRGNREKKNVGQVKLGSNATRQPVKQTCPGGSNSSTAGKIRSEEGNGERVRVRPSVGGKEERCQLYLKAIAAGWKKDLDGSWIKDSEAEFDSDDEPPTVC